MTRFCFLAGNRNATYAVNIGLIIIYKETILQIYSYDANMIVHNYRQRRLYNAVPYH